MITFGELEGKVLRVLNKLPKNRGFYTEDKCYDAIQEALTFVAVEMFEADEGWQTKIQYLDTTPGQLTLPVPPHMSMIKMVRYLRSTEYVPLTYDTAWDRSESQPNQGGLSMGAPRYRIIDNCFYFNPSMDEGGSQYLMVEYMSYPRLSQDRMDTIEAHFDACMQEFLKYKAATILEASYGKNASMVGWASLEAQWYQKILAVINRRNMQTTYIREFGE